VLYNDAAGQAIHEGCHLFYSHVESTCMTASFQ